MSQRWEISFNVNNLKRSRFTLQGGIKYLKGMRVLRSQRKLFRRHCQPKTFSFVYCVTSTLIYFTSLRFISFWFILIQGNAGTLLLATSLAWYRICQRGKFRYRIGWIGNLLARTSLHLTHKSSHHLIYCLALSHSPAISSLTACLNKTTQRTNYSSLALLYNSIYTNTWNPSSIHSS